MSATKLEEAADPINRRQDQTYEETSTAFAGLLATIDQIVSDLGGTRAARAIVSLAAREATAAVKVRELGYQMTLCDVFVISAAGFRAATQTLKDQFRIREEAPVSRAGRFQAGRLAVRGDRMYFETDRASVMLTHCYQDTHSGSRKDGGERWTTAVTEEAQTLLHLSGLAKLRVCMTHSKSQQLAIKRISRVAEEGFKVSLHPPEVQGTPAA